MMPRLGIEKLPVAKRRDRPSRHQRDFESRAKAREEDKLRAKALRSPAIRKSPRIDQWAAAKLVRKLERASMGGEAPASLASSTYLRMMRNRLGGAMWRLVRKLPPDTYR